MNVDDQKMAVNEEAKSESLIDELWRLRRENDELRKHVERLQLDLCREQHRVFQAQREMDRLKGWIDCLTVSIDRVTGRVKGA